MVQIITNSNGGGAGGGGGDGDMKKSVYDPNNINADAFDYNNFENTPDLSGYQTKANLVTDLNNPDNTHYPSAKAVSDAITSAGGGDMLKSVYDPDNVNANAFDYDNFINTPTIPTKTSDLNNDSGFITEITSSDVTTALGYTPYNSTNPNGYISGITSSDVTSALGYTPYNSTNPSGYVTSTIINNTAYGSGWDGDVSHAPTKNAVYDKINAMDTTISTNTTNIGNNTTAISTINGKIPSAATSSNQLADKNYVDDSINSVTAYYITKDAQGNQWATRAELFAATTFYSGGVVRVPTKNDYTIVLADEQHDNATTRYIYNSGWEYQYTVNETALTQAQLDALNSGITSGKVSTYDGYASTISGKQDELVSGTNIKTINNNSLLGSGNLALNDVKVSSTAPSSPTEGMVWYDTTNDVLKTYNGTSWDEAGGGGDVRVFAVPSVNDNISDMITRLSAGKGVILHETVSGTDVFYKVDYHDSTGVIDASLISDSAARFYTINYSYLDNTVTSKTSSTASFFAPGGTATTGYVVTKTASGYEWQAPTGGIQLAPNTELNIKYHRYGSQASYDSLNQYYTDTANDTAYFTI